MVFNTIIRTNQSRTLKNHISCECKCMFDETECNSNEW